MENRNITIMRTKCNRFRHRMFVIYKLISTYLDYCLAEHYKLRCRIICCLSFLVCLSSVFYCKHSRCRCVKMFIHKLVGLGWVGWRKMDPRLDPRLCLTAYKIPLHCAANDIAEIVHYCLHNSVIVLYSYYILDENLSLDYGILHRTRTRDFVWLRPWMYASHIVLLVHTRKTLWNKLVNHQPRVFVFGSAMLQ